MAGSWTHMTTRSGKLRNNKSFTQMIENLGDAYEAAGECYGMIWWLAAQLAPETDGHERETREAAGIWVMTAKEHYRDGLRIGGVQRER